LEGKIFWNNSTSLEAQGTTDMQVW